MKMFDRRGILAGAATLCASAPIASERPQRLRAADNQSLDFPTAQALLHMDRFLRAQTKGRLGIQVFASGQLGEEDETIQQTRVGAIHLTRVNAGPLAAIAPACGLFCLPYLFRSDDHLSRVLDSDVGRDILAQFETRDLVGLAFYEAGARSIYNRTRIVRTPADLRDLRIRTQRAPMMESVVRALGARAVALSYSQVLPALQAGLIDGGENNWPSYVTTDHHRAAPSYTLTEHTRTPDAVLVSKRVWDGLSRADQDLLREAAAASRAFHRARFEEWTEISQRQAEADGVTLVADFDRAGFEALCAPLREAASGDADMARLITRAQDLG